MTAELTWDRLDRLVEEDTLALRDEAWAEIERLRALSREPRVWLQGDTVPAGVYLLRPSGFVGRVDAAFYVEDVPHVEVFVPDYTAVVAAARTAADGR